MQFDRRNRMWKTKDPLKEKRKTSARVSDVGGVS